MNIALKLKNGNREELTVKEARELYNELRQIFGRSTTLYKPFPNIGLVKNVRNTVCLK